jgi:uncharacterized phiE125 gp8 family phage protein
MLALKVVTPPAVEPVTLVQAKAHCRVETDEDDALLTSLIKSARQAVEEHLGRYLIETEADYQLDRFPTGPLYLPRPPLLSVTSITYSDFQGGFTVWDPANTLVDAISEPARITPAYLKIYPFTLPVSGAVKVRFKGGYCTAAAAALNPPDFSAIPEPIRQAILMLIHDAYDNRSQIVIGATVEERPVVRHLLGPYRFVFPRVC